MLGLSDPAPAVAQRLGGLTSSDIEAAIVWGEAGSPAPYLLHHSPGPENPIIVGSVYTPYVRVALAARAALRSGSSVRSDGVPPHLLEPVVWVALRWYCCDPDRPDPATFTPWEPFDYRVAVPGDRVFGVPAPRPLEAPLWVRRDLSQLAALGGPAYPDTVLLVGYRPDAVARGGDIAIFREVPSQIAAGAMDVSMRVGRITAKDLANWRSP